MKRRLGIWSVSETGLLRKDNQDHIFISGDETVFCVADGMGGGSDGALASRIVCEEMESAVAFGPGDRREAIERAIRSANSRICDHALRHGFRQMGSTAVVLMLDPDAVGCARVCHVGDSRVYRIRAGIAELMTVDHTVGNQLVHMVDAETAKNLRGRKNPLSHILTRAVGAKDDIEPDWREMDVCDDDWFLVCSDGVHDVLDEKMISGLWADGKTVRGFSDLLRNKIFEFGAPDNFSYIIIAIESAKRR